MIKYTRKQINLKPSLYDKEFVELDDCLRMMSELCDAAVKAGADENKLMKEFDNG